ncbi:FCD domain-containing protein [Spinactinospora alkalitolerans]
MSGAARHAVFAPLDDGAGRSEAVARRLGRAIALGLIADGEQLPTESELATALNVSTVTLREALSSLRRQGLVETRRGRGGGSFVRASADALTERARRRLREMGTTDLRELGDFHAAIAGAAARLAADRASADNIARLREIVDRLAAARPAHARRRIGGRYYIEVAAAAQSVRLTTQEIDLQSELGELLWSPMRPALDQEKLHERTVHNHRAVIDAVERRAGDAARALTERHIEAGVQRLIELHFDLVERDGGGAGDPPAPP